MRRENKNTEIPNRKNTILRVGRRPSTIQTRQKKKKGKKRKQILCVFVQVGITYTLTSNTIFFFPLSRPFFRKIVAHLSCLQQALLKIDKLDRKFDDDRRYYVLNYIRKLNTYS